MRIVVSKVPNYSTPGEDGMVYINPEQVCNIVSCYVAYGILKPKVRVTVVTMSNGARWVVPDSINEVLRRLEL